MKFRNMPVILSLLAGFIVCITTFVFKYDGTDWLLIVLGTLILFYILGLCLRRLFEVILSVEEKDEDVSNEEKEDTESIIDASGDGN